jgi:hypothetical protein
MDKSNLASDIPVYAELANLIGSLNMDLEKPNDRFRAAQVIPWFYFNASFVYLLFYLYLVA